MAGFGSRPGRFRSEVIALGEDGASEADIPVHDRTNRTVAGMLAEMNPPDFPVALGMLYCQPEGESDMRLPDAAWAEQDRVLATVDVIAAGEIQHQHLVEA